MPYGQVRPIQYPSMRMASGCMMIACLAACATKTDRSAPIAAALAQAARSTPSPTDLEKSCQNGEAADCLVLASRYKGGMSGVAKDKKQASRYYNQAATLYDQACAGGLARSCEGLGSMYEHGGGVAKDESKAARLYDQACTGGFANGCDRLGRLYEAGRGVAKDEGKAAMLFERACEDGIGASCFELGGLYQEGRGVQKDERSAARYFERSCEHGYVAPCTSLAEHYLQAFGVENAWRAAELFDMACAAGDSRGCAFFFASTSSHANPPPPADVLVETVRRRAESDIECPESQVAINPGDGWIIEAQGCEWQTLYRWTGRDVELLRPWTWQRSQKRTGSTPPEDASNEPLPFEEEMTRPVQLAGKDPSYTRRALEAHVQGLMIVKCVITTSGQLADCRIVKPLAHMNTAVLSVLATRKYKPVTFRGKLVSVDYVFNIKLVMPGAGPEPRAQER